MHMKNILGKLAANDRTHAVTIAMTRGNCGSGRRYEKSDSLSCRIAAGRRVISRDGIIRR
jgi:hypothetical protein